MAESGTKFDLVENRKAKSHIWRHFGFIKTATCTDADKTRVGCRLCMSILKYSGNTTNLTDHIRRKHPTIDITSKTPVTAVSHSVLSVVTPRMDVFFRTQTRCLILICITKHVQF